MSSELTMEQILEREFEIVMSAIYTEPDDQSAWWYHQFLLSNIYRSSDIEFGNNLLQGQVGMVEELLQVEPDCKLAKIALTHIMELFIRRSEEGCEVADSYRDRRQEALELLCETDKMHVNRYRYLLSMKL